MTRERPWRGWTLAVLGCIAQGCSSLPEPRAPEPADFVMPAVNRGAERYSAWFGDSDGRILYFGLSPFWHLWWRTGGDARADLEEPGDHLIGRFDLESERFLAPLRVREMAADVRSSVWDVLVHSSGRICFTTYFEEIGCVDPSSGDVFHFEGVGTGFNELTEGPEGRLYVTRYSSDPMGETAGGYGSVVVLTIDGEKVAEHRLENPPGEVTAPKSVAVDPATGEIWLNTDTFRDDGSTRHETIRLSARGEVMSRRDGSPELHFMRFDASARGWFAEARDGELWLRVAARGAVVAETRLAKRSAVDFVQDLQFAADGRALVSLWSGRVFVARLEGAALHVQDVALERPPGCNPSLFYSAFLHAGSVYATLFCDGRIVRTRLGP